MGVHFFVYLCCVRCSSYVLVDVCVCVCVGVFVSVCVCARYFDVIACSCMFCHCKCTCSHLGQVPPYLSLAFFVIAMAHPVREPVASFEYDMGGQDGALTFDEAVNQVAGCKLTGPESRPMKSDRPPGDISIKDLPIRFLDPQVGSKLEQFCDVIPNHPGTISQQFFDDVVYRKCATGLYKELPEPWRLRKEPSVPYSMQIVILPDPSTPNGARESVLIFKHVYLHKNKLPVKDCSDCCCGMAMKFDWGTHTRVALMAFNFMLDKVGGKQIRFWCVQPKFQRKLTIDNQARADGYRFIRDQGPRANNQNQFMEWTDEQIHTPGSPIEGWQEGKVNQALHNYMRRRQNAKTLEYWPFTLKSFVDWFFDGVLVTVLPSIRQHGITWIGRTRTGKSLGSKTILFAQSKFEIDRDEREDLVPSIVTAKHLEISSKRNPLPSISPASSMMACSRKWMPHSSKLSSTHLTLSCNSNRVTLSLRKTCFGSGRRCDSVGAVLICPI